uniref:PH domain-containing protein n=1 Tax=Haptolina brevifila TaxID=156173 RepID=A0A7S2CEE8_9EUKA|mmetsp:Transcript_23716/g.47321  ORF Transcript_23716/g.47321 Transcript_23716/m.47321 type:complete len:349 (+) Transcript_23716:124-1170(+)
MNALQSAITEVDITALLQPRTGYLFKLGGGQETGSKWNRRWFVLRDNVLMYFQAPKDFLGFRDKPNGVVLLDEANVRLRDDKQSGRPFTFVLSHVGGESVVLAAESETEMHAWMQAVRTSRMCVSDPMAANMMEEARRTSAENELDSARDKKSDPEAELKEIEQELEKVQAEHRELESEKEKAEKQLKELMARFKLRKALLHWRHRKLTLSFRSLVTMVFRSRIEEAKRLKEGHDRRISMMDAEIEKVIADRQRAEAAKRKSDEMLTKELALKKEKETELREAQRLSETDTERSEAAAARIAALQAEGAQEMTGNRDKDDILRAMEEMQALEAETDHLTLQVKRRMPA